MTGQTKRRITLLLVLLFAAMMPIQAFAEVYVAGTDVSTAPYWVTEAPAHNDESTSLSTVGADENNYNVAYTDASGTATVTLNNADIIYKPMPSVPPTECSAISTTEDLVINLKGENTVNCDVVGDVGAHWSNAISVSSGPDSGEERSLTINGEEGASLTAEAGGGISGNVGISADQLTINSGNVTAIGHGINRNSDNGSSYGVSVSDFTMEGGSLSAASQESLGDGESVALLLQGNGTANISGGTLTAAAAEGGKAISAVGDHPGLVVSPAAGKAMEVKLSDEPVTNWDSIDRYGYAASPDTYNYNSDGTAAASRCAYIGGTEYVPGLRSVDEPVTGVFKYYYFTVKANEGGSVSPNGIAAVTAGGTMNFEIRPDAGFEVEDVLLDGVSILDKLLDGVLTLDDVMADHVLEIVFAKA